MIFAIDRAAYRSLATFVKDVVPCALFVGERLHYDLFIYGDALFLVLLGVWNDGFPN